MNKKQNILNWFRRNNSTRTFCGINI